MSKVIKVIQQCRDMVLPEPVFDFWCQELGLLHRRHQPLARVIRVVRETSDAVSLWLQPNANFSGIQPGQHINIGVEIDGRWLQRSYSVSQVEGRRFRITARAITNGVVSNYLNQHARRGMVIQLGEVYGEVTVADFEHRPALFLAGGIGITPIISMVESWSARMRQQPVQLLYWGKRSQDLAFVNRLRKLAQTHSWFDFKILETDLLERNADGSPKLVAETSAWFQDMKDRLGGFDAFACGSDGFVHQLRDFMAPFVNRFHFESFTPLAVATELGHPVQVRLTRQQRSVSIPSGANLLQALEQAGVAIRSGCRRGTCNTCSCKKVSGLAQHQLDRSVHSAEDSGFKPCTYTALSDMTLEL